ncbi:hypothetical protein LUZ63_000217 [Rhynchospora breviuscula]|uniref:Glutamate receptor n=1 Tax=Rhynchospora breviuscula TaxID=2022672 RepID=A0A9Q0HWN3_9POAL|nr:hypothetical protein LUZ63_000217 [Rhynchospora breviuscula]
MAMEDFYTTNGNYSTRLMLHTRDSNGDNYQAAEAALDLLQNMKIQAIIGPEKSSQAVFVSEIGNKSQVPVISFSATSPTLSSMHLPFFIRTTINDAAQVYTITALIKAFGWREVVPIYEDTEFGRGIIPFLTDALDEIDVRIPYRSLISESSTDDRIQKELYKLQTKQTRVFVVHMAPSRGSTLFLNAIEVGMMSKGYVWIMTNGVTNVIGSLNASVISAMSGALGIQTYVPQTEKLENFATRWRKRFLEVNPNDEPCEVSTFALWAYDTIYALAMAVEEVGVQNTKIDKNITSSGHLPVFYDGPKLLNAIYNIKFQGLSGSFQLKDGQMQNSGFDVINVVKEGKRKVGYWREGQNLSRQPDLSTIVWPGETNIIPKGWEFPVSGRKLRVGVMKGSFTEFVKVEIDPVTNDIRVSGRSVDVFEAAIKRMPYAVPYEYQLFGAVSEANSLTYNDFVYQVYLQNYDVAIGDIAIRYNRTLYVDFTVPYTESGVAMIVPVKTSVNKNTLIFLRPLSLDLWIASFVFFIYTGIAILILEPNLRASLEGSISGHFGTIVHLSVFAHQEKLESILSKVVVIVWVFVLLVLTSSYTASLSSMLTVQQLQPTVTDVNDLIKNGDYVGYGAGSFVGDLLRQLNFEKSKIRSYKFDKYDEALRKGSANGGVAAIVEEIPYVKSFLAKHCKSYTMIEIYKSAGFGFAFPKGSALVPDISRAIINITDGDDIIQIEKKWSGDQNCQNNGNIIESNSLSFLSFWGLFLMTGVVSTVSLLICVIISLCKNRRKMSNITSVETSSDELNDIEAFPTMNQDENQEGDREVRP